MQSVPCLVQDDSSGRQRFVITPTRAGYSVSLLYGRYVCNYPNSLLTGYQCPNSNTYFAAADANTPQIWQFVPYTPAQAPLPDGLYTLSSVGRAGCNAFLTAPACGGNNYPGMGTAGSPSSL